MEPLRLIFNETGFSSIAHKAPPGKREERNLNGSTPFSIKKWGLKPQKFEFSLGTTKANVNESVFPSISHKSHPWKTGTTKLEWVTPFH